MSLCQSCADHDCTWPKWDKDVDECPDLVPAKVNADLLAACKLAKQHLDAMCCETPIADFLLEPQKAAFRHVDETLTAEIKKAEGA